MAQKGKQGQLYNEVKIDTILIELKHSLSSNNMPYQRRHVRKIDVN